MKFIKTLTALFFISIALTACGNTKQQMQSAPQEQSSQPRTKASAYAGKTPGKVTISFDYQRIKKRASDQLAIWIEDPQGNHVRTLLVTKFTASGGYQKRAATVPNWQRSFQPGTVNRDVLDAISSATPQSGPISVTWDCRNQDGDVVPAGSYVYKVEANIQWEKTAFWQGTITVGPTAEQSIATPTGDDSTLLQAVRADFSLTP